LHSSYFLNISMEREKGAAAAAAPQPKDDFAVLRELFKQRATRATVRDFKVRETLGTGTFGRVRLVTLRHQSADHHLALKMMKKSVVLQLKQVEHIRSEKAILSTIQHPFIVNMITSFQDTRRLYMLMEYVAGGELFAFLGNVQRLDNENARFYAAEIALAFEYLHSHNIVYRDLKPENLLIDSLGHMKIADFGFAKILRAEEGYRTWTLCGTPEYLAPEIIQSKGHGKPVDWWALGILIYEMLAGYAPFFADDPFGIYQKILAGKIKFPSHFSDPAKDIISSLLTADRTLRLGCGKTGTADIKAHPWFAGLDWDKVYTRQLRVPYKPPLKAPDDTSLFEKYDDSGDEEPEQLTQQDQDNFTDF
jgi:protein kinase X